MYRYKGCKIEASSEILDLFDFHMHILPGRIFPFVMIDSHMKSV